MFVEVKMIVPIHVRPASFVPLSHDLECLRIGEMSSLESYFETFESFPASHLTAIVPFFLVRLVVYIFEATFNFLKFFCKQWNMKVNQVIY